MRVRFPADSWVSHEFPLVVCVEAISYGEVAPSAKRLYLGICSSCAWYPLSSLQRAVIMCAKKDEVAGVVVYKCVRKMLSG